MIAFLMSLMLAVHPNAECKAGNLARYFENMSYRVVSSESAIVCSEIYYNADNQDIGGVVYSASEQGSIVTVVTMAYDYDHPFPESVVTIVSFIRVNHAQ